MKLDIKNMKSIAVKFNDDGSGSNFKEYHYLWPYEEEVSAGDYVVVFGYAGRLANVRVVGVHEQLSSRATNAAVCKIDYKAYNDFKDHMRVAEEYVAQIKRELEEAKKKETLKELAKKSPSLKKLLADGTDVEFLKKLLS